MHTFTDLSNYRLVKAHVKLKPHGLNPTAIGPDPAQGAALEKARLPWPTPQPPQPGILQHMGLSDSAACPALQAVGRGMGGRGKTCDPAHWMCRTAIQLSHHGRCWQAKTEGGSDAQARAKWGHDEAVQPVTVTATPWPDTQPPPSNSAAHAGRASPRPPHPRQTGRDSPL